MLNQEKHRQILFQIIKDIFTSAIGQYLAFKGGTACYFLYGLERFSTDLDFDLLEDRDIDTRIVEILKKYGSVKKGQKLILSFGEGSVNIKIDISRKVWKANLYEFVDFYGTTIRVQDRSTIFANKLVAITERDTNRDIYDVYFFFQHMFDINESVIIERTGGNARELYKKIIEKLKNLPRSYRILDGLGEVLDEKQKKFAKEKLVSELVGMLQMKRDLTHDIVN